jgi:transcriptional regulator with XRE-family HTH domain
MANERETVRRAPYLAAGETIRRARQRRGWTQRELAEKCIAAGAKFGHSVIANWERGEFRPNPGNLLVVVQTLNLDIDAMLAQYDALAAA